MVSYSQQWNEPIGVWKFSGKSVLRGLATTGFCEGFLDGNTEVLFLEDEFAVVCYHARLESYPVTLPIGVMTTKIDEVKSIKKLVDVYLSSSVKTEYYDIKDFGLLHRMKKK